MKVEDILSGKRFQGSPPSWILIGELVERIEDRQRQMRSQTDRISVLRQATDLLAKAGHPIGVNQIGKIARVYRFLIERGRRDAKYAIERFANRSIVALELAHRLYLLDEAEGRAALDWILDGEGVAKIDALYREAKGKYGNRLSSKSVALLNHQALVDACIAIVSANGDLFFGVGQPFSIAPQTGRSPLGVSVDFTARVSHANGEGYDYDGFETLQAESHKAAWWRRRADIVFAATFFRRFFLFVAGDVAMARLIAEQLQGLRVANAGVIRLAEDYKRFELLLWPTGGPEPDRRDLQ